MTRPGIRYRPATLYGRAAGGWPGRAVHLVDAENLLGTPAPGPGHVLDLARCYARRVGFGPMDQVVIGCSHRAFTTIGFCWRGPQYLLRSGPDGADLALLAVLAQDHVAARFAAVVIASRRPHLRPRGHRPGSSRLPGHGRQPPRPARPVPGTRGPRADRLPRPARPRRRPGRGLRATSHPSADQAHARRSPEQLAGHPVRWSSLNIASGGRTAQVTRASIGI
jgi:hypothetical protein